MAKPTNVFIIQVYVPTADCDNVDIEQFYADLENTIKNKHRKDLLIVQGDWNAKIGEDAHENWKGNVRKFGLGNTNERGLRLLEFTKLHNLILANTLYPHKKTKRVTWSSPDGITQNQIDYILMSKRYQSSIHSNRTQSFPGADIGSDHELVMVTFRMKLRSKKKES